MRASISAALGQLRATARRLDWRSAVHLHVRGDRTPFSSTSIPGTARGLNSSTRSRRCRRHHDLVIMKPSVAGGVECPTRPSPSRPTIPPRCWGFEGASYRPAKLPTPPAPERQCCTSRSLPDDRTTDQCANLGTAAAVCTQYHGVGTGRSRMSCGNHALRREKSARVRPADLGFSRLRGTVAVLLALHQLTHNSRIRFRRPTKRPTK